MRAMILAAGLGTRLRPLTLVRPKVLVPLLGTAVLDFWVSRLYAEGASEIIINAYHLHENLSAAIEAGAWPIPIHIVREPVLLGTGGGIRNALSFFQGEPFVVVNGDVICNLPLTDLHKRHLHSASPAGLLMHDCPEFNNVAVDREGFIRGFGREANLLVGKDSNIRLMAFTGVHFIDPSILEDIPPGTPADILTTYRKLIEENRPPRALIYPDLFWREMGSLESYKLLNEELCKIEENRLAPFATGKTGWVHPSAQIAGDARLRGFTVIGRGCRVMRDVQMENTILWDNVVVEQGSTLLNCIVTDGLTVQGMHENETLFEVSR